MDAFFNRVDRLGVLSNNLRRPFDIIGRYMVKTSIRKSFRRQKGLTRWQRLSPVTLAEKRRLGYGNKGILVRTGRLRRGYQHRATSRSLAIKNRVKVKGGKSLAAIHQHGTRDGKLPKRDIVVLRREDEAFIEKTLKEHLDG